jgi:hypothetical protein
MRSTLRFSGMIPANLLPFTPDYAFDEANYRQHPSQDANGDLVYTFTHL